MGLPGHSIRSPAIRAFQFLAINYKATTEVHFIPSLELPPHQPSLGVLVAFLSFFFLLRGYKRIHLGCLLFPGPRLFKVVSSEKSIICFRRRRSFAGEVYFLSLLFYLFIYFCYSCIRMCMQMRACAFFVLIDYRYRTLLFIKFWYMSRITTKYNVIYAAG